MFSNDVTLILGAGASEVFGLPLGRRLREILAETLAFRFDEWGDNLQSGNKDIYNAFLAAAQKESNPAIGLNDYLFAARDIADAMPICSSIDDYIERHADHGRYENCAKIGIAHAILLAERNSPLRIDSHQSDNIDFSQLGDCWTAMFLQALTRRARRSELKDAFSRLRVISFNYDRCFEQFTFHWLRQLYKIDDQEAAEICNEINIVHPYGSLGELYDQRPQARIAFGAATSPQALIAASNRICTYSESVRDKNLAALAKYFLDDCTRIVVLGFAFHQQNMDLLKIKPMDRNISRHVFASTIGISNAKWEIMRDRLSVCLDTPGPMLYSHTDGRSCEKLLEEFLDSIES